NGLRLVFWETATLKERKRREAPAGPVFFRTFSEDSKALAYTEPGGTVHVEDLASGKELRQFKGHQGEIFHLMFSRDRRLLVTGSQDGTILIWDLAGGVNHLAGNK